MIQFSTSLTARSWEGSRTFLDAKLCQQKYCAGMPAVRNNSSSVFFFFFSFFSFFQVLQSPALDVNNDLREDPGLQCGCYFRDGQDGVCLEVRSIFAHLVSFLAMRKGLKLQSAFVLVVLDCPTELFLVKKL